ncbi:MAG: iron-sulfur cluster repair di-iron protein [Planctomycetota bacterium]
MATLSPDTTLATLVTDRPGRSRVFESFGLDYCCHGGQSLEAACAKSDKNLGEVLEHLAAFDATAELSTEPDFGAMGMTELVDHIESTHHAYVKAELEPLSQLVEKVARVHGANFPWLAEVRNLSFALFAELAQHLGKEEQVLFPMIRELDAAKSLPQFHCGGVNAPIAVMEMEHDSAGEVLRKLRELTSDYSMPEGGCNSFRAMLNRLEAFEYDLHRHIHKENSLLYPKALAAAEKLG